MLPDRLAPDPTVVAQVAEALEGVPRAAYSVPHVYPAAAPAYTRVPREERPHPPSDRLSLYVHLPYCRYRCTFCHFAVRVGADLAAMERYVAAVRSEVDWIPPTAQISELYVGGGTPTALPSPLMDELLDAVFERTIPYGRHVHTIETSPETISDAHLDVFHRHGIGRVSMGVQSLEGPVLDTVRREQTAAGALAACELLLRSGLIVNIDLIYGLPGQTPESFLFDLTTLAELGVPSLTLYSLHVTERTPVTRVLGDDRFDLPRLMGWRAYVQEAAEQLGYTQTRWHSFKRLDTNAGTHEFAPSFDDSLSGTQLGVGMSARSHLGHAVYRNHEVHDTYVERIERGESPVEEVINFHEEDLMTQFVARSLGDGKPLRRADYERTFGHAIDTDFGALLDRLRRAALLEDDGHTLALSERGKLVYDLVMLAFYPEWARAWLTEREDRASFVSVGSSDRD
jgi:oxygen-independent coproporphyrinogen III oxidase